MLVFLTNYTVAAWLEHTGLMNNTGTLNTRVPGVPGLAGEPEKGRQIVLVVADEGSAYDKTWPLLRPSCCSCSLYLMQSSRRERESFDFILKSADPSLRKLCNVTSLLTFLRNWYTDPKPITFFSIMSACLIHIFAQFTYTSSDSKYSCHLELLDCLRDLVLLLL